MVPILLIPGTFLGMIAALVNMLMLNASLWQGAQTYIVVALLFPVAFIALRGLKSTNANLAAH